MEDNIQYFDTKNRKCILRRIIGLSVSLVVILILLIYFFYFSFLRPWNDCQGGADIFSHSFLAESMQQAYKQYGITDGMSTLETKSVMLKQCQSVIGKSITPSAMPERGMGMTNKIMKYPNIVAIYFGEFLIAFFGLFMFGYKQEPIFSKAFRSLIISTGAFIDTVAVIYFMSFFGFVGFGWAWYLYVGILLVVNYLVYHIAKSILLYFSFVEQRK